MKSSSVFAGSRSRAINASGGEVAVVQNERNASLTFIQFRSVLVALVLALVSSVLAAGQVSVLTNRYDNGRTSLNDNETFLNPANVNASTFAKLGSYNVDGYVVAQPLYMQNVLIGGTSHNVVFVATQHDSLYAFDADNLAGGAPLWQHSFINPSAGITTVPISEQGCAAVNGYTEMGIQGTPVIDPVTSTLYVDVKTKEVTGGNTAYIHRLHAVNITNGADMNSVQVSGSVQGARGTVTFDSAKACQRPGLLLVNGTVYIAFGSNACDTTRGWVFAYDESLNKLSAFSTSPNQPRGAAIWQGGAGLVADPSGNVFFITANGPFNVNTGGSDFGDSFMKLTLTGNSLNWTDYFTPFDQANMAANDLDLGSGGAMLLASPNVLIGSGKTGTIYVVDPNNMGKFNNTDNTQIIQWKQSVLNDVDGTPAFWNNIVYFAPGHGPTVSYQIDPQTGLLGMSWLEMTQPIIPVGGPIISANGTSNGILWLIRNFGNSAQQISAFEGISLNEIYNSSFFGTRDTLGTTAHFVVPTVANGKVYVGTQTQLVVYGLMPVISNVSGGGQTGVAGSTLPLPLTIRVTDPYTGAPRQGVTVTFAGKGTFGNPNPVTDSTGTASTTYTLPTTFSSSSLTVTVTSPGSASTLFSETVTPGSPSSITVLSGGSQSGTVGTTLPKPLVFKVGDQSGNAISGVSVSFSDTPNHGIFSSNPTITDSLGKATVSYTLSTKAGFDTITASVGSLNSPTVQERGLAGAATLVAVLSGNNQTANKNTLLPQQLKVKVTDQYGNVVAGVTVSYKDNGANGVFSSTTAITNSSGVAGVSYTTPNQSGTVTINATVTGLPAAIFTVHVN